MHSLVTSIFLYACVSWTLTAEQQRRIQPIEMRCYPKIPRISYKAHVTNKELCAKIQQAIQTTQRPDHHKETHTKMVLTCLRFIRSGQNLLARHSERRKTRQAEEEVGKQHQEWTGLEFAKSQKAVESRGKWMKLSVKSSVVPQRPLCLRDRGWWRWSLHWQLCFPTHVCDFSLLSRWCRHMNLNLGISLTGLIRSLKRHNNLH